MSRPSSVEGLAPAPPGYGDAELTRVVDGHGERVVVERADDRIACSNELIALVGEPGLQRVRGDLEVDGDRVSFGVPGEGLGRLMYRVVGRASGWHLLEREATR